jgi:eukaryotic-like serine/threonine-protein kinase
MSDVDVLEQVQTHVAGYRLEREIGRGRQTVVYLASQPGAKHRVALKVRREAPGFEREFATQAALDDPHVIAVFDGGWSGGAAYLAMEYAAGGSMVTRRGPFGHATVLTVMTQAAGALRRLHLQRWVHRDVKPANLLVRGDGDVALSDFGSARRAGQAETLPQGTVVGTPRYAAPEQSRGAAPDPAADVYSLGVCLHEMLTGQPPYAGVTATELLGQHLLAPVPRLPREHALWQPLLDAMLAKEPRDRLADGEAVLLQLQRMEHSHLRNPS